MSNPGSSTTLLRAVPDPAPQELVGGDLPLVERACLGDVEAWSRLYQETFDGVFRHICFFTGDACVAEDLVQDAYARAFAGIAGFDQRSSFASWVRGIALNLARMYWRRSAVKQRVHNALTLARTDAVGNPASDPSRQHEQDACLEALYALIHQLPETLREAFILRDLEGLSPAEVAQALGITPKNATVRATRARARLRDELLRQGWSTEEPP